MDLLDDPLFVDLLVVLEEASAERSTVGDDLLATLPEVSRALSARPELRAPLLAQWRRLAAVNEVLGVGARQTSVLPNIPGYGIEQELGRGGMGIVYRARHLALGRVVAIKVLLAGRLASPRLVERFRHEAETVARAQHSNIVQVFEVGDADGVPWVALEYAGGGSLADQLRGTPQSERRSAELVGTLARAVAHAHAQGIVHRDLKPSNILLSVDGTPKIADFGLAKLLDTDAALTRTGEAPGTPSYMAPEQLRGAVSPQVDVYALGAVLYECLTGRPPFLAETPAATLALVQAAEPASPRQLRPRLARDLETICLKCLEREPTKRYPSATALADDLKRFLDGQPIVARPVGALGRASKWAKRRPAVAGLLSVIAAGAVILVAGGIAFSVRLGRASREIAQRESALAQRVYAADMRQLADDWNALDRKSALAILDRHRPVERAADRRNFAWYHLHERLSQQASELAGHEGHAYSVSFHPALPLLASCGADGKLRLWDVERHVEVQSIEVGDGPVSHTAWSPNGESLAASTEHGTLHLYDFDAQSHQLTLRWRQIVFQHDGGRAADVAYFAFSPDSKLIAHGGPPYRVCLWECATGALAREEKLDKRFDVVGGEGGAGPLVFTPDGSEVIVAALHMNLSTTLLRCSTDGTRPLRKWRSLGGGCYAYELAITPDGKKLLVAGSMEAIRLIDLQSGRLEQTIGGHGAKVLSAQFSRDGRRLLTCCEDGLVRVWNTQSWTVEQVSKDHTAGLWTARYSLDESQIAACGADGAVTLWDGSGAAEATWVLPNSTPPTCLAVLGDGSHAAIGTETGEVHLVSLDQRTTLDVKIGLGVSVEQGFGLPLEWMFACPATKTLVVASRQGSMNVWNIGTDRLEQAANQNIHFRGDSPNGRQFAGVIDGDDQLQVFDSLTLQPIRKVCADRKVPIAIFDQVGGGLSIPVFDSENRPELKPPDRWSNWSRVIGEEFAAAPWRHAARGEVIAAQFDASTVYIFDMHQAKRIATLHGAQSVVSDFAISPRMDSVATGSPDGTVVVWDVATETAVLTFTCVGPVRRVAFSPSGERLVAVGTRSESDPAYVHVWDASRE